MFCGFNQKMLEGLTAFSEALVEHGLIYRTEKNGETIEQGIRREISDMTRFLEESHRIDDAGKRIMTEGIVKYVIGFYLIMRKNNVKDYKEVIKNLGEYFMEMDKKYYSELEGQPEDMKDLTNFLNQKKI